MALDFFTTSRAKLRALKGDNPVASIGEGFKALAEDADKAFAIYAEGTHAARPAAGLPNRFYRESDTGVLLRDNGAAWEAISWPGRLSLSAAVTAPDGWLKAEGQAVSRSTYALLFAAIGTVNGAGDGSTTFNLPDYRERAPVGAGGGLAAGAKGGEATHTLGESEMPAHAHGVLPWTPNDISGPAIGSAGYWSQGEGVFHGTAYTNVYMGGTDVKGGGAAHNNMQPYTVCNVLIKT